MTGKLVIENLKHKPMRSLLSILLIGVPVTLILSLVGLSHGMLEDTQRRTRGIGADIFVRPPGSSAISLSGAPMPEKITTILEKRPHITQAVGMVAHSIGPALFVTGIDLDQFNRMSGGFTFIDGGPFNGPDQIIVDRYYAAQKHLRAGSTLNVLNKDWRVIGIIESGKLARVVLPLKVLQNLTSTNGMLSQVYLKLDDPANTGQAIADLKATLPEGSQIYSMQEFLSQFSINAISGLPEFIGVVIAIGVIIGFAVVCLSMYMAVLQRTREIGILKAIGGSKGFIMRIILTEALLLGLGGTVLGILMSFGAWWLVRTLVPSSIPMMIVYEWWWIAGAITLARALLGALYPGLAAARHDPIEALAYE